MSHRILTRHEQQQVIDLWRQLDLGMHGRHAPHSATDPYTSAVSWLRVKSNAAPWRADSGQHHAEEVD